MVTLGEVIAGSDHDSQRRFQNDLKIDNTAYLRALMHADGNIQYANYQNETQVREYLTSNGYSSEISDIIS